MSLRGSKATETRNSRFILRNSRFSSRNSKFPVIPQLDWGISIWNSKFICDEIPRSSRGMTKNASQGMTQGLGIPEFLVIFARNFRFYSKNSRILF